MRYILSVPFKFSRNYNEGWNAFHAAHALGHQALYPPLDALTSNNYPPLSFYLVGGLGTLIGDNIIAGRILSLLSFFVIALCIGILVYWDGNARLSALFASLAFLAFMGGHYQEYIGVNDPQLLGHAFQWVALLLVLKAGRRTGIAIVLSLLCLGVSLLIKQNLLALPVTITCWLFLYNRKGFYTYCVAGSILACAVLGVLYKIYGDIFFTDLLRAPRLYSLQAMVEKSQEQLTPMLVMAAAGIVLMLLSYADRYVQLMLAYTSFAIVFGTLFAGGNGVTYNVFFDVVMGLAVMCGFTINRSDRLLGSHKLFNDEATRKSLTQSTLMLALSLSILITIPIASARLVKFLHQATAWQTEGSKNIEFIRMQQGPAMCEALELCYWAGKSFEVDVFNAGQKLFTGVVPEAQFIALFKKHYFAVVHLEEKNQRLPKDVEDAIFSNYAIHHQTGPAIFLVPKK